MRRRRLLILFTGLAIATTWYVYRIPMNPEVYRYPDDVLETVDVEMWPDAISRNEDVIRLRFHYRNLSNRKIERFTADYCTWNWTGDRLLFGEMAVTEILQPDESSSWSVSYHHGDCPWISTDDWRKLAQQDIRSLALRWRFKTVTFMDGTVLTLQSGLPFTNPGHLDSTTDIFERFQENRVQ